MRFKVVNPSPLDNPYAAEMLEKIGAGYVQKSCWSDEELVGLAADADGVISSPVERYGEAVIAKLAKCQVISNMGVGYDTIDVDAATRHGICVSYVPDYCMDEVAEHAMALILACARRLVAVNNTIRAGNLVKLQPPWVEGPVFRVRGQTLGLVGFGRIPRTLVRKAQGFGLRIIVYDPYVSPASTAGYDVEMVDDLGKLLRQSDFVSVHVPLSPDTAHMFGLKQFKQMKPTAYFINTARGGLVDQEALEEALTGGYIAGAALDVIDPELYLESPLLKLENLIYTGHSAFYSEISGPELRRRAVQEVIRVLQGKWPQNWANPAVKDRFAARWGRVGRKPK